MFYNKKYAKSKIKTQKYNLKVGEHYEKIN